jgi:hypothetical protein
MQSAFFATFVVFFLAFTASFFRLGSPFVAGTMLGGALIAAANAIVLAIY